MSRDDDLDEPLSTARALERADHGKQEKAEQRRAQEQKKELQKLKLDLLKKDVKGQPQEAGREDGDGEDAAATKTREQEVKRNIDTVKMKPDAEKMLQKQQAADEAKKLQGALEQGKDKTA